MQPITLGRMTVATPGTNVKLGRATLAANMSAVDTTFTISSAVGLPAKLFPCVGVIDNERILLQSISGTTITCRRIDPFAAAHLNGTALMLDYKFAGLFCGGAAGNTGSIYVGTPDLVGSTGVGVIKEIKSSTGDFQQIGPLDYDGNTLNLTDYALDAANANEGPYVTLWVR